MYNDVTFIGNNLAIYKNDALTNLAGLQSLSSIGGYLEIVDNLTLTSLTGLADLSSIGGELSIFSNSALTSLSGLDNINSGSITYLHIQYNFSLSTCEVESICDYLASPNGIIFIWDNSTGCNSKQEVEHACATVGVETLNPESSFTIYPNPALTNIIVKTPAKGTLFISNLNGQDILQQEIHSPFLQKRRTGHKVFLVLLSK